MDYGNKKGMPNESYQLAVNLRGWIATIMISLRELAVFCSKLLWQTQNNYSFDIINDSRVGESNVW